MSLASHALEPSSSAPPLSTHRIDKFQLSAAPWGTAIGKITLQRPLWTDMWPLPNQANIVDGKSTTAASNDNINRLFAQAPSTSDARQQINSAPDPLRQDGFNFHELNLCSVAGPIIGICHSLRHHRQQQYAWLQCANDNNDKDSDSDASTINNSNILDHSSATYRQWTGKILDIAC
ncbi:hypothetical protein PV08_03116 [Exophiala spinifera]|uniref:Uncharacterized protein n=1 Tax=Exophiala spinifera TaxID=91928 RepID=A0A0D2A1I0_9EURO|nr:uncharacterized protein PV08_03116 [Exophiala spinifera]KIW18827.1 hypothetical protein PV08_03116 [Exophiala spinifera]